MVPQGPDYGRSWTPTNNKESDQDQYRKPGQVFINQHRDWDSEHYLSIAMHGYNDPAMRDTFNLLIKPASMYLA